MVELQTPQMNSVFHALGDATRRYMLRDLASGERTVSQLAQPFAISLAAASKHIKVLENAGMIRREVRGRTHLCRLDPGPLASAHEWLSFYERFWSSRLDLLEPARYAMLYQRGVGRLRSALDLPSVEQGHDVGGGAAATRMTNEVKGR